MTSETRHSEPSLGLTIAVFVALLVLLVVTVLVAQVELGSWNFFVAAAIASLKAVLILLVFMRVYESSQLIWLFAIAGLVWLGIMFNLVFSDYLTRDSAKPQVPNQGSSSSR